MTTDKRVKEIVEKFDYDLRYSIDDNMIRLLTQYHQDISTALVEALEGKKTDINPLFPERCKGFNQALTEAQNIIKQLLESKN